MEVVSGAHLERLHRNTCGFYEPLNVSGAHFSGILQCYIVLYRVYKGLKALSFVFFARRLETA